ncbi:GLPGLI family protein [Olleya namhaensis]|nr:GLPGLI family protein [Olleya namhaensis]
MLKNILFSFLLIQSLFSYAQKDSTRIFEIDFIRVLTPQNSTKTITSNYKLKIFTEHNISVFANNNATNFSNDLINDDDDDAIFYFDPKGKNISLVYKNYYKNKLFSKGTIAFKDFTIKDSLTIFNWSITKETKKILGFNCQLAETTFRGRNYRAWFSSELPIGGPWKYDGLPGMILQIETQEPFISFKASQIKSHKIKLHNTKNPFENDKFVTWQQFKDLYKKKAIALSKYTTESDFKTSIISPRMGIERYIEENDKDYTADKDFEKLRESQNEN